jgi:hypothetical protein
MALALGKEVRFESFMVICHLNSKSFMVIYGAFMVSLLQKCSSLTRVDGSKRLSKIVRTQYDIILYLFSTPVSDPVIFRFRPVYLPYNYGHKTGVSGEVSVL